MSEPSNTSFPPSNCQTILEFKIIGGYGVDSTINRNNVSSSSTEGSKSNNNNNGEVDICMKYDKKILDGEIKLGFSDDENANKELMKEFISAINYGDSYFYNNSYNQVPCGVKQTNTNKWIWKNAITIDTSKSELKNNGKYKNTIGVPPRTQSLCLGYLGKLSVKNINDFNGISRLLYEWIIAAKLEGQKLEYQYKNNGDKKKLCKALAYSYADYGDLIKGTSIWGNANTKQLEINLKNIFETVFKNQIEQNGQTSGSNKYPGDLKLLREAWWNTNKKYILGALIFGAETLEGKNGVPCLSEMKISPPTTDYIPQFLRFTQEWIEHFCDKRKAYAKDVVEKCKQCNEESDNYHKKNTIDSKKEFAVTNSGTNNSNKNYEGEGGKCWENNGKVANTIGKCDECKSACEIFKAFVEGKNMNDGDGKTWRDRWQQMNRIYGDLIKTAKKEIVEYKEARRKEQIQQQFQQQQQLSQRLQSTNSVSMQPYMMKCGDNNYCLKPNNDSFYQYLAYNGYTTLNSYMNLVLKDMDCGDDKPRWDRSTVVKETQNIQPTSSSKKKKVIYPQLFGERPSGYKYACECRIPSREELCRDNHMYNTRWECGKDDMVDSVSSHVQSSTRPSAPTGVSGGGTYVLCNLRHDENDETDQTSTRGPSSASVFGTNLTGEDLEFFSLFDSWYKDIQDKLDRHFHRINRDCKLENIMVQSDGRGPTISPECQTCRDNCECYKLWVNNMKDQWEKQKKNYEIFQNKSPSQKISLNDYLFSRCWAEYFEKDVKSKSLKEIDVVEDIHIINLLQERCGEDKVNAENKFQERIKKAENEKKICHKKQDRCQKGGETLNCDAFVGNVIGCNNKYYDNISDAKTWNCTQTSNGGAKLQPGTCVPPRTQTLCVANMYSGGNILINSGDDENNLKQYIMNAMKKETQLLYDYYTSKDDNKRAIISKTSSGQKGKNDSNYMPKNFCKAAERTYNDFKHMVLGDVPSKTDSFNKIHEEIKKILQKQNNKQQQSNPQTPENWWDTHSDKFWDAVKCGIKTQTQPDGSKKNFSGNECGEFPPDDTDNQFVWWFKEWGQQFCFERKKYIDAINEVCDSLWYNRCDISTQKTLKDVCQHKCQVYKDFIQEKHSEWIQQKTKYESENPEMFAHELFSQHYPECVDTNFELIFEEKVSANSKPSKTELKYDYADASDICSCKDQTYACKNDGNKSTCKEKGGDVTTWRTHLLKTGKDGKPLRGVYVPPRRQKLCLANLYPIIFGKDKNNNNDNSTKKNELLNRLKIVAEREAYYLWLQHVTKDKKLDTTSHNRACCAIRSSFFDIGDIVKGADIWDDPSKTYIHKTLNDIFGKELEELKKSQKEPTYENPILYLRKKWWEIDETVGNSGNNKKTNRDSIWDAMQCGVKNAITELNGNGEEVQDKDLPKCIQDINQKRNVYLVATPQFVRWLEEWSQQFCDEYPKHMEKLGRQCKRSSGNNNCNDHSNKDCKDVCAKYNDWISLKKKEWDGMSKYYSKILQMGKSSDQSPDGTDYDAITQPTAIDYLNQKCNKNIDGTNNCCHCKDIGKDSTLSPTSQNSSNHDKPLEHMHKVVNKIDDKYKKYMPQCTKCYIQHIRDQIENITDVLKGRKEQNTKGRSSSSSNNPCAQSTTKPDKNMMEIAQIFQAEAETQLNGRGGDSLKGDASKGTYNNNVNGYDLKDSNICNLEKTKHTNDGRGGNNGGPCKGKGLGENNTVNTRFVVGFLWQKDETNIHESHKDVIMPPRRRHICTSNLENLFTSARGLNGDKVNNSFFGDVLLTAKYEAEKIISMYKGKNKLTDQGVPKDPNHRESICHAVRGSFADIGDIIRGRDLWSRNGEMKLLEGKLKDIFGKIKTLVDSSANKYSTDTPQHTNLRKDWWEANRKQVWEAMKCAVKDYKVPYVLESSSGGSRKASEKPYCGFDDSGTPLDDYIPQRLRWLGEWAEWFCKAQKDEYDKVRSACEQCKGGTCGKCNDCKEACGKYTQFINDWKQQWTEIDKKYKDLYQQAKSNSGGSGTSGDRNQEYLDEFLKQLKDKNTSNITYGTAAGYVHEEIKDIGCNTQKYFCEKPTNGGKKEEYAFEDPPKDYKQACDCQEYRAQITSSTTKGQGSQELDTSGSQQSKALVTPQSSSSQQPSIGGSGNPSTRGGSTVKDQDQGTTSTGGASGQEQDTGQGHDPNTKGPDQNIGSAGALVPQGGASVHGSSVPTLPNAHDASQPNQKGVIDSTPPPGTEQGAYEPPPSRGGHSSPTPSTGGTSAAPYNKPTTPKDEFKELNTCPFEIGATGGVTTAVNNETCKKFLVYKRCISTKYDNNLNNWKSDLVKNNRDKNEGVLMPPRRTRLCRAPFLGQFYRANEKDSFINHFYTATFNQGILLGILFKDNKDEAYESLKNSFYDYGDIIKGTDLVEETLIHDLNERLNKMFPKNSASSTSVDGREQWWNENKKRVWNAMLCGYHKGINDLQTHNKGRRKSPSLPSSLTKIIPDDWCPVPSDDTTPQFLRWMTEWSRQFCEEKGNETISLQKNCLDNDGNTTKIETNKGYKLNDTNCLVSMKKYKEWIDSKREQWQSWEKIYKKKKQNVKHITSSATFLPGTSSQELASQNDAEKYVQMNCDKCDCNINNLEYMYKQVDKPSINAIKKIVAKVQEDIPELKLVSLNDDIKFVQDMIKKVTENANIIEEKINPQAKQLEVNKTKSNTSPGFRILTNLWNTITKTVLTSAAAAGKLGVAATTAAIDTAADIIPQAVEVGVEAGLKVGIGALDGIKSMIPSGKSVDATKVDCGSASSKGSTASPGTSGQSAKTKPSASNVTTLSDILTYTVTFPVGFLLGAFGFLFFYLKKKPILRPTKLFSVIDIPQNDYGIPDETSTNRYIPYGRYKGKTYIYVEEHCSGRENIFESDTTDITSSESEYEELHINDIYKYKSPKYKTLIDLVLKPSSKTHDAENTHIDHMEDTIHTPNNNPTDDEWNQLKQDFISQYLENIPKDLPNENTVDDNMPKDIQPDILPHNMEEKPFITFIQDRFLDSSREDVTYNINWNVPKHTQIYSNITHPPKDNNLYSGTDLINDSLNSEQHVDIYDELLKRKENELFGTKHPKNTTKSKYISI
ncbi:erythrocyte membrane protein 1, PfEMP1, putative [Plasmodium sp. gorilla clade G2]|uniref:erythrocyte membrane protein 1, PfEMP1, putative n=1 Tax=Plasmodium sp. gorilla clade G2 TaxID=880535 RepID=UPI000D203F4C|nr:erythrocyte membrane protein 1, PfEMP1, putative [Plasmodium sp. gorilla clade G2]SOV16676.1 erythrocyte membrane protein 1, PfEMP1, putative [Plasmodium sp. gorilla clade G2]